MIMPPQRIADLVRPGAAPPRMADQMHVSRFCVRGYTIVIAAWSRGIVLNGLTAPTS